MRRSIVAFAATLILAVLPPVRAGAQTTPDAARAGAVVEALTAAIVDGYTFRGRVDEIVAHLETRLREGAYDGAVDASHLARLLTDDLREVTDDLHFGVRHDPERYARTARMLGGTSPVAARFSGTAFEIDPGSPRARAMDRRLRTRNYDLRRLEVLEGNVGYLELGVVPPLELARPTVDAAMAFLSHVDAMILDLRESPGGTGGFIPYLMSWFLPDGGTLLYTREFGAADTVLAYRTVDDLPGPRLDDVPLYVLTSGLTGSAAENLAYTLQQHGRATVVGETSAGAAHSATTYPLVDGFVATVPIARVVHPETGSNWQGTGVVPDVASPASEARARAHVLALDRLVEAAEPARRQVLEAARRGLESEAAAARRVAPDPSGWDEYVGRYGSREVFVENGSLRYRRAGQPAIPLERIEADRFRFDLPPGMRARGPLPDVRFERDAEGEVVGLSLVREDGTVEAREARDRSDGP